MPLTKRQKKERELRVRVYMKRSHIFHFLFKPTGKRCLKCKASLICNTSHVPEKIARCKKCNTRYVVFSRHTVVTGVEKCPGRKSLIELDCAQCLSA